MTSPNDMRRAPWRTPTGGPIFFVSDGKDGMLAALADNAEYSLTENAKTTLEFAKTIMITPPEQVGELSYLVKTLCESLRDALYVAELRGERLGIEG